MSATASYSLTASQSSTTLSVPKGTAQSSFPIELLNFSNDPPNDWLMGISGMRWLLYEEFGCERSCLVDASNSVSLSYPDRRMLTKNITDSRIIPMAADRAISLTRRTTPTGSLTIAFQPPSRYRVRHQNAIAGTKNARIVTESVSHDWPYEPRVLSRARQSMSLIY